MRSETGSLRILLATEAANAGVGRHVIDLAEGLAQRGASVHIAYSPVRADETFSTFIANCKHLTIGTTPVVMSRSPGPSDLRAVLATRRLLAREGPFDIHHAHSSKAGAILRLAVRAAGTTVYTPNAMVTMAPDLSRVKRVFFTGVERVLQRRAGSIIAVSDDERDEMVRIGIQPTRIRVVPMGSRTEDLLDRAAARRLLGLPEDAMCVGWVGRISAQKAPEIAVAAVAQLSAPLPHLVMIGDGPSASAVARQISGLGISDAVMMPGALPAGTLMRAFDVLLSTSRYESFGLAVLEAAAAGVPVVATRKGISSSILVNGGGLAIDDDSVASTSEALAAILHNSAMRERMGVAARAAASAFTVDAMIEGNVTVYREMIGFRGPVGREAALPVRDMQAPEDPE